MIDKDYVQVLQQLLVIALPSKKFNGHPPCPYLARGLSTGKVVIERGIDPTTDVRRAEQHNTTGKFPLLIVQNKKILEAARNNLPPDYPFEF